MRCILKDLGCDIVALFNWGGGGYEYNLLCFKDYERRFLHRLLEETDELDDDVEEDTNELGY